MMTNYEKYQLEWMIEYGYSLKNLIKDLENIQYQDPENLDMASRPITEIFTEWENNNNVWTAEDEWTNENAIQTDNGKLKSISCEIGYLERIQIPKIYCNKLNIHEGSKCEITICGADRKSILITPKIDP